MKIIKNIVCKVKNSGKFLKVAKYDKDKVYAIFNNGYEIGMRVNNGEELDIEHIIPLLHSQCELYELRRIRNVESDI